MNRNLQRCHHYYKILYAVVVKAFSYESQNKVGLSISVFTIGTLKPVVEAAFFSFVPSIRFHLFRGRPVMSL
jgi:hypothetical protein